jgi:hypothetical protein
LALHGKRITYLEERKEETQEIKVPDYTRHFEELKTMVRQHSLAYSSLQIYAQINHFKKTISELPKVLPVEHHHYFTGKSKGFFIGGLGLLLIRAITIGLSFGLYRENTRMKENDIRFRMIRQLSRKLPGRLKLLITDILREQKKFSKNGRLRKAL